MTWPQAHHLSSHATPHQDVYFNMWRLRWFAHALVTSPARLFDANIFYPERRTLALSDAMFVEGLLAAPLSWAGMSAGPGAQPLLLAAMTCSGVAMFALARYLTGSRGAGLIAGIVFAFAPYRFEHFMHMELQWAMWTPLAFLALHRAYDTGRWRYGLATGACVALQMLSSIYYGIFLCDADCARAPAAVAAGSQAPRARGRQGRWRPAPSWRRWSARSTRIPYLQTHERVGDRPVEEVSALPRHQRQLSRGDAGNWLYGATATRGAPERRLFPGVDRLLLMLVGLLLRAPSRRADRLPAAAGGGV